MTGPDDYVAVNDVLTFEHQPDGTSSPQCISVQITNDNVYEAVEMFVVELQSTDVSPDPSADSAMVVIMNEDSTFLPVSDKKGLAYHACIQTCRSCDQS